MKDRINNLQVLRAFAALMVVYVHTRFVFWRFNPFGVLGVPVFFVISGFIMANVCAVDSSEFFKRRLIRILPLYWIFTLLVFALALVFPELLGATRASLAELCKSLFFIPFRKTDGLIAPMLYVGWTLNYEMLFYAVISIGLLLSKRFAIRLAVLSIFVLQVGFYCFADSKSVANFYASPLMYDFIAGVIAYNLYDRAAKAFCVRIRIGAVAIAIVSFLSLVVMEGMYRIKQHDFRVCLFAFLLVLSMTMLSKAGADSRSRTLILIGDASYVLYLSHPFTEMFIARILTHLGFQSLRITAFPGMLVSLVFSTLVAIGIHLWLERPLTRFLSSKILKNVVSFQNSSLLRHLLPQSSTGLKAVCRSGVSFNWCEAN